MARVTGIRGFWEWLPVVLIVPILVIAGAVRDEKDVTAVGVLTAVVACLPLVVRGNLPFKVLAPLMTAGIVLVLWRLAPGDAVVLIPAVALAELASRSDGRRYVVVVGVGVVPCILISVAPSADDFAEFVSIVGRNIAFCWLALAAGDAVRSRREAVERAGAAAEEQALRRLSDERLRIARDVHDVVAHAMVAINVQAGVAAHLIDTKPEQARSALRDIKAASGEALTDLRATLGVLRADAPVAPTTGLGDLEDLAAGLRAAGVTVSFELEVPADVPAAVGMTARRIVQEALTNALRHAAPDTVHVCVAGEDGALRVEVVDERTGTEPVLASPGGSGSGVAGMRERAQALGGTLEAGPVDRGWRVLALLPA